MTGDEALALIERYHLARLKVGAASTQYALIVASVELMLVEREMDNAGHVMAMHRSAAQIYARGA